FERLWPPETLFEAFPEPLPTRLRDSEDPAIRTLDTGLGPTGDQAAPLQPAERLVDGGLPHLRPEADAPGVEPLQEVVAVQGLLGKEPEHDDLDLRYRSRGTPSRPVWPHSLVQRVLAAGRRRDT